MATKGLVINRLDKVEVIRLIIQLSHQRINGSTTDTKSLLPTSSFRSLVGAVAISS